MVDTVGIILNLLGKRCFFHAYSRHLLDLATLHPYAPFSKSSILPE